MDIKHTNPPSLHNIRALGLILQENSFQFTEKKNYLQTHGTAMGTIANIFMGKVESQILNLSAQKPLAWTRYIDDIFSIWNINKDEVTLFIEQANRHHPTIKFTAEVSDTFLDTNVYKGERFAKQSILDIKTHSKANPTFQYTHFSSCHPPGIKKGFILKGKALRLLRSNSSETAFKTTITQIKTNLIENGYPETLVSTTLAEITFEERKPALQQKPKQNTRILPFVTQYRPSVPIKQMLMQNLHLIHQKPLLSRIFKDPPALSSRTKGQILTGYTRPSKTLELCRPVNPLLSLRRQCTFIVKCTAGYNG